MEFTNLSYCRDKYGNYIVSYYQRPVLQQIQHVTLVHILRHTTLPACEGMHTL